MKPEIIKTKIQGNFAKMKDIFFNNHFTLNKEYIDLMKENIELQNQCEHKFVNGVCIYCQKEQEKDEK